MGIKAVQAADNGGISRPTRFCFSGLGRLWSCPRTPGFPPDLFQLIPVEVSAPGHVYQVMVSVGVDIALGVHQFNFLGHV
jgi:hypothetical protein